MYAIKFCVYIGPFCEEFLQTSLGPSSFIQCIARQISAVKMIIVCDIFYITLVKKRKKKPSIVKGVLGVLVTGMFVTYNDGGLKSVLSK